MDKKNQQQYPFYGPGPKDETDARRVFAGEGTVVYQAKTAVPDDQQSAAPAKQTDTLEPAKQADTSTRRVFAGESVVVYRAKTPVSNAQQSAAPAVRADNAPAPLQEEVGYVPMTDDSNGETAFDSAAAVSNASVAAVVKQDRGTYLHARAKELGRAGLVLSIISLICTAGGFLSSYLVEGIPLNMQSDWFFVFFGGAVLGFLFAIPVLFFSASALKNNVKTGIPSLIFVIISILVFIAAILFFTLATTGAFVLPTI